MNSGVIDFWWNWGYVPWQIWARLARFFSALDRTGEITLTPRQLSQLVQPEFLRIEVME